MVDKKDEKWVVLMAVWMDVKLVVVKVDRMAVSKVAS